MKIRVLLVFVLITSGSVLLYSQQIGRSDIQRAGEFEVVNTNAGASASSDVGTELIQTLLIDDFEYAGEWNAFMQRDEGFAVSMKREGSPKELANENNRFVLGVRADFMRRFWSWVTILPPSPAKIKGITKSLSVWVVGRNYKHRLDLVLRDYMENPKRLKGEEMRWVGWKQVKIIIPDTIQQENYKVTEERGITFLAFEIYFSPEDIYLQKSFYVYFDYFTADADLFSEKNQNPDDMIDGW